MEYKYKIGDKVYYQKPLVLGQIKQLEEFLEDFIVPNELNITTIMSLLGNKLPFGMAIILIEEGKSLAERFRLTNNSPLGRGAGVGNSSFGYETVPEIMNQIALDIALDNNLKITVQVIKDFFVCNPIESTSQELSGIISALGISPSLVTRHPSPVVSNAEPPETGLTNSASSLPEGTSPDETTSSGDIPLLNARRITNTAPVT